MAINVAAGGVVDGSSAALNLTTAPISANGTSTIDNVWFNLASGAVFKRLVTAGVATPLWIGPSNTNYSPVMVTPATTTVFTAVVATGNSLSGLITSKALNRTWTVTPATTSSTTMTFGYNGTTTGGGDANSGCDPTANMNLWYNNGTTWSALTSTPVTPAAGTMNDKTVTFTGVSSFPTFAILNPLSSNANLSGLSVSAGTLSPVFASTTTSCAVSVSNATTAITLTPTVNQANATVTVNGSAVASGTASGSISLNWPQYNYHRSDRPGWQHY